MSGCAPATRRSKRRAWSAPTPAPRRWPSATLERLETLVRAFENPAQGYVALRRPMFRGNIGDYGHLARVGEWSISGEAEGE